MSKKKSAIDDFDLDFSDVINNAKNPAISIIEQAPAEMQDENFHSAKKSASKKSGNQYQSLKELLESGKKSADVKYVRLTPETFAQAQAVKNRFGVTIQDLVNTATYAACRQILENF
jgi:predicted nucleic acid-binding protein